MRGRMKILLAPVLMLGMLPLATNVAQSDPAVSCPSVAKPPALDFAQPQYIDKTSGRWRARQHHRRGRIADRLGSRRNYPRVQGPFGGPGRR